MSKSLVVGDKVSFEEKNGEKFIVYRFPRTSFVGRLRGDSVRRNKESLEEHVFAANIDIAVIVATAAEPEFQPKMIDRYIIICEAGNVLPIICLNKCDLTEARDPILKLYEKELEIKVVETSATQGTGIEELKKLIEGKTAIVIGKSGVGKSSIVNAIIPDLSLETKNIGKNEGTHTTTSSNLYEWQENSLIIDTPGIRKLDVGGIDKKDLKKYFHEFDEYGSFCKFNDCLHIDEPENACGIKQAVKQGLISEARYGNYLRIVRE